MSESLQSPRRLFFNLNTFFNKYSSSSTGNAQHGDPKTAGSLERRMVDGFKNQVPSHEYRIGALEGNKHLVLREGDTNLLNLKSFKSVVTPRVSSPPSSGSDGVQLAPHSGMVQSSGTLSVNSQVSVDPPPDPDRAISDSVHQVTLAVSGSMDTWKEANTAKETQLGKWFNKIYLFGGAKEAVRTEVVTRDHALRLASDALKQLDTLATRNPAGDGQPSRAALIEAGRQIVLRAALSVALGGKWDGSGLPPDTERAIKDATSTVLQLHDKMRATGAEGYSIDKLVAALSQFGAIAELGRRDDPRKLQFAAEGLGAVANTIMHELTPPRDGAALNALAGLHPELDHAVKALRVEVTTQLLVAAHKAKNGDQEPDATERNRLKGVATKVVSDEMALAEPRRQIGRVLEKAGVPLNGASLQGVRIDGNLIAAIRHKLGPDTQAAGLIMAGLLAAERAARGTDAANELRAAAETLRRTATGGDARALEQRIGSLGDETATVKARAETAATDLKTAQDRFATLSGERNRLASERLRLIVSAQQKDRMVTIAESGTSRQILAIDRLIEVNARNAELKLELQALSARLPGLEKAVKETKTDYDARVFNRTQQGDKLAYLSDQEVELLELKGVASFKPEDVVAAAAKLAKRGLASAQQAHDMANTVNFAMEKVGISRRYVSSVIQSQERNFATGRPGDEARRLQDRLLLGLTGQVESFQHRQGSVQSAMQTATQQKGLHQVALPPPDGSPSSVSGVDPQLVTTRQTLATLATQYDTAKNDLLSQIANDELPTKTQDVYAVLDQRRTAMGEDAHKALRDTVRAAILQVQQSTKSPVEKFNPAEHADMVRTQLNNWSVDTAAFRPEIDLMLSQSFGTVELGLWIEQAPEWPSGPMPTGSTAPTGVQQDRYKEESASSSLLRSFDNLSNGSKIRLTGTGGFEVTTGGIPLEPTGTASLTLKGGADSVGMFEIAQGSDGIEVILMTGWQARGGVEVSTSLMGQISSVGKELGLQAGVSAGLEGGGAKLQGVVLKFDNTEAGRQAARHMLEALISGKPLAPIDLGEAEIRPVVEDRGSFKTNATARFGWQPPQLAVGSTFQTSALAKAGTGYSLSTKQTVAENLNQRVVKTETAHMIDVSGSVTVGFKAGLVGAPWTDNGKGKQQPWTPSSDVLDIGLQKVMWSVTTKAKIVQTPGGRIEKSSDLQRLAQPAMFGELRGTVALGGPILERMMNPPEGTDPAKLARLQQLKSEITALANLGSGGDQIVVAFSLRESVRETANSMLSEATALREGRIFAPNRQQAEKRAKELEDRALAMINDEDNFVPSKVMLQSGSDVRSSITALNLVLVRVQDGIEDKREGVTAEIPLPSDLVSDFDVGPGRGLPTLPQLPDDSMLRSSPLLVGNVNQPPPLSSPLSDAPPEREVASDGGPRLGTITQPTPLSSLPSDLLPVRGSGENPTLVGVTSPPGRIDIPRVPDAGRGEDMYAEYQNDEECGICAINALFGRNVLDADQMLRTAKEINGEKTTESVRGGFDVMSVAVQLEELLRLAGQDRITGEVRIGAAQKQEGSWRLPVIEPGTDRVVVFQSTRVDDITHNHFVAFRKDQDGDWWLLDSRNPGVGGPKREKITPEAYAARFGPDLLQLQVIGSGVAGSSVSPVVAELGARGQ